MKCGLAYERKNVSGECKKILFRIILGPETEEAMTGENSKISFMRFVIFTKFLLGLSSEGDRDGHCL
jgi:hypothetical protein